MSIAKKVIKNTFYNIAGQIFGLAISFVLIPYIVDKIGIERFGVWALIGVVTGYFGLLDFGIKSSFVKFISEFYALKDMKKINQSLSTSLIFYLILHLPPLFFRR